MSDPSDSPDPRPGIPWLRVVVEGVVERSAGSRRREGNCWAANLGRGSRCAVYQGEGLSILSLKEESLLRVASQFRGIREQARKTHLAS